MGKKSKGPITAGDSSVQEYIPRILESRSLDAGGNRMVTAVEMLNRKTGDTYLQPFYKSSGTSVSASKKDSWMPFMGRRTSDNWYIKGYATDKNRWMYITDSPEYKYWKPMSKDIYPDKHFYEAVGPYSKVSSEIKRLEGLGYYKSGGYARTPGEVNKWLEGFGGLDPFKVKSKIY